MTAQARSPLAGSGRPIGPPEVSRFSLSSPWVSRPFVSSGVVNGHAGHVRQPDAGFVDEDERIDPLVGDRPRRKGLENRKSHHSDLCCGFHEDRFATCALQ